jgi:hypothetical protein
MSKSSPAAVSPQPGPEPLFTRLRWPLGLFAIVFILVAATIWPVLQEPDQVLAFNDGNIESQLAPSWGSPNILFRIWDNQFFFGMGGGQYPLSFTAIGESFGPEFYRRWAQPWIAALCALGIYWALRQFKIGRPASVLASAIMVCSGWPLNSAIIGLAVRMMALACSAVALGFVERGRLTGKWLPYMIGGGFLGLAVAEVPDVGLLFAFSSAAVFWWTHLLERKNPESRIQNPEVEKHKDQPTETPSSQSSRAKGNSPRSVFSAKWSVIPKFALYVAFCILLSWQTVSSTFSTQIQGVTQGASESPEQRYNWATQWSLPPAELWNTVSGSYFGTSMNSPSKPYWGRMGREVNWETSHQGMRNFALSGWHIGVIPCTLTIVLIALAYQSRRRNDASNLLPASHWLWLISSGILLSMMLMWGRFFFVYKLFWSLPYMSTFRCADKWNGPFLLFVGFAAAIVLNALWKSLNSKEAKAGGSLWRTVALAFTSMSALALAIAIGTSGQQDAFINARIAEGYKATATLMWQNAVSASFKVFFIASLCALGAWWIGKRQAKGTHTSSAAVLLVIGLIALGDLTADNLPYAQGHKYKHFLQPNPLTDYLDAHRTEGRLKLMPPNHPLLNNLRMTLLQVKGYDLFEPISVSRMPTDYAALFKAFETNPARLWELGSLRYFLTLPGGAEQLNKLDGNRGRFIERLALGICVVNDSYIPITTQDARQQYLRVVEFTGALPKYRLISDIIPVPSTSDEDQKAMNLLSSQNFDNTHSVILHQSTHSQPLTASQSGPAKGTVSTTSETPVEVTLSVNTTSETLLARSCKYDANWQVMVDEKPRQLERINLIFQGVMVPIGQHTITFSYDPPLTALRFAISTRLMLIFLIVFGILLHYLEHRKNAENT